MKQDKVYRRYISSRRWLRLRREKMTVSPLCEECAKNDRCTAATEVHHRIPVESVKSYTEQQRLMFDFVNLMSVCHECHVKLHVGLKKQTKEETIKRNKDQVERIIEKFFAD